MQNALAHHGIGLVQVAAHQELKVLDADAGILAGQQHCLRGQLVNVLLGKAPELQEPNANDRYISHATSSFPSPVTGYLSRFLPVGTCTR